VTDFGKVPETPPKLATTTLSFPIHLSRFLAEGEAPAFNGTGTPTGVGSTPGGSKVSGGTHLLKREETKALEQGFEEKVIENVETFEKEKVFAEYHIAGCYSPKLFETEKGLVEHPKAEGSPGPANLCVYTGREELGMPPGAAIGLGIATLQGSGGASQNGAAVIYENTSVPAFETKTVKIRAQGTWAVTE
jgi:hypothetical protein